ncbi:YihY/virulence factor BrkB family protein [Anianabacter salinae]|uniref:YihY/virulence factor BrkB family protein n=1 Tax=Anianabacter salinae TaxID=2851023 RepID=UPI00225E7008|nr:YihY/virulence factor BrkB family protein [Anianabacter salinae]MBV0913202.1 YihY/virulence factor BrkB family protein [Anianabacter salinae]
MPDDPAAGPGRLAQSPFAIPARGWAQILRRVFLTQLAKDHVGLIAAGVAFYGLLALFPAITALIGLAGLAIDPAQVTSQIEALADTLPAQAADIVRSQAVDVAGAQQESLTLVAVFGLGLAVFSASKGVGSLIEGLNVAYDEQETRGYLRLMALRLVLTLVLILGLVVGLGAAVVLPAVLAVVNFGAMTEMLIGAARWALLLALASVGLAVLYRYAPDRRAARWLWLTPGSVLACILWLLATIAFAVYAENFGSYNESFGAIAGVIVLLMWLWISAYVVLIGAEINAEAERQTRVDTTVGPAMPMGVRGAVKADTLPPDA